jgi:hypothetical protein
MARVALLEKPVSMRAVGLFQPLMATPLIFGSASTILHGPTDVATIDEWRRTVRVSSLVPRARSGTSAIASATVLARSLIEESPSPVDGAEHHTGIAIASSTSTASVAYRYEATGRREGWSVVDPFGLPNAIPSAIAAQVALTLHFTAFATTFIGNFSGFFFATLFCVHSLSRGNAHRAIVLGTEELTSLHIEASRALTSNTPLVDDVEGAAGMLLEPSGVERGWTLTLTGSGVSPLLPDQLPEGWRSVAIEWLPSGAQGPCLNAVAPARRLLEILDSGRERVLLGGHFVGDGWGLLGFQRSSH